MKKLLLTSLAVMIAVMTFAQVYVKGYVKKNGTYVAPHIRSSPDGNPYNNYSYPGNTNPYTGKVATGNPDTYLNNYYHTGTAIPTTNFIPFTDSKTYLKNKSGINYAYITLYQTNETIAKYTVYSIQNIKLGSITYFRDGTVFYYDANGKLM